MVNKIDTSKMVFVFGSNEGGIHGGGAARFAYKERGARWGLSYGHFGDSFAIPTKGFKVIPNYEGRNRESLTVGDTLSLDDIQDYVRGFIAYARGHPELQFQVTCIGCGLAGLKHHDVAGMFADAPENCYFDLKWKHWLNESGDGRHKFWGEG
jgi:hypothetical protein